MNEPLNLLIDIKTEMGTSKSFQKSFSGKMKSMGTDMELVPLDRQPTGKSKPGAKVAKTYKCLAKSKLTSSDMHPWDLAQLTAHQEKAAISFAEPDADNVMMYHAVKNEKNLKSFLKEPNKCSGDYGLDVDWPPTQSNVWHLGNDFSQLGDARNAVRNLNNEIIRVAHFDTGYDGSGHSTQPVNLNLNLQRNFRQGEPVTDASDTTPNIKVNMPGHGTATLALLAGRKVAIGTNFNDELGGAPFAEVVPFRISNCVVLEGAVTTIFKTSAFYAAMRHIVDLHDTGTPFHALTMSMGGVASKSWADIVNEAYDKGIVLVSAAGNNFSGFPTRHLIYPARFKRVLAACGVTNAYKKYYHTKINEMQGNYGPTDLMDAAISAFTPNVPWAIMGCKNTISYAGAGTSSATPQVAAAVACIWKKHKAQLDTLQGWQRVETIRALLFNNAKKNFAGYNKKEFGMGVIQTMDALNSPLPSLNTLAKQPEDKIGFFYLDLLSGMFKATVDGKPIKKTPADKKLLNMELLQLVHQNEGLENALEKLKLPKNNTASAKKKIIEQVIESNKTSNTLKLFLKGLL
jgi:Subtilase family